MTKKEAMLGWTESCKQGDCHAKYLKCCSDLGSTSDCNSKTESATGRDEDSLRDKPEREWNNQLDFLFSCISVSVGLGNVWRFPYLCYKNGGGVFLVIHFFAIIFCGIPMFFQEVAIGQYLRSGGMTLVGKLCPLLAGTGYATMIIVFLLDVYYCVIVAWTFFYLFACLLPETELPWGTCGHWWNSETCSTIENRPISSTLSPADNASNVSLPVALSTFQNSTAPVEEFWENRVLMISDGLEDWTGMQWELFYLLILSWVLIYNVLNRSLRENGKIIWFTALFPYVMMVALLVRTVTLEGAMEGLKFLVVPDWSKALSAETWIDGTTQIFFGYSIGVGTLPALGSYNRFNHNSYKDTTITCIINTLTCLIASTITFGILGHLAVLKGVSVAEVVDSGPGLVFITYPEVVLKLPAARIWSIMFFVMLLILGLDSEFCNVESFITGVMDKWPRLFRDRRKSFTFVVCTIMCLLGIPMVSKSGMYVFQLMDFYAASGISLLWVCFFQTIAISWIFGIGKFCDCVEEMMGFRPSIVLQICWTTLAPLVMLAVLIFYLVSYTPLKYGDSYEYPEWGEMIGFFLCISSMIWIPGYALYFLAVTPGTLKERIQASLTPEPNLSLHRVPKVQKDSLEDHFPMPESKMELLSSGLA